MLRNILATIAGLIVAFLTITLIEKLGHIIFPYPEGAKPNDMEWLKNNIALIPRGAMVFVILAHGFGVAFGMGMAGFVSKSSIIPSYIVAGIMITITAIMLYLIPSPLWFTLCDSFAVIVGALFGKPLAQRFIFN